MRASGRTPPAFGNETMAATITSDWRYADFRSKDTVALRLAAANLHDAEVRKQRWKKGREMVGITGFRRII